MRRLVRRTCWIVGLIIVIGTLLVLNHLYLPSYVNVVRLRNESGEPVTVHYRGTTFFEWGTVALKPGETRKVVVDRGEMLPSGYSVRIEAHWDATGGDKSVDFRDIHPRDGAAIVIIGPVDLHLERPDGPP